VQPFWRFLVWGNSWQERIIKMVILFLGIIGLPIFWKSPAYIYLTAFGIEFVSSYVQVGTILAILIALAWILLSIGRAFELSGVPNLQVANELINDRDVFRLRLLCEQKDFETRVWLMEVFHANGGVVLGGRFPAELATTNSPGQSVVSLKKGIPASVSVAEIRRSGTGSVGMLFYTGADSNRWPIEMQKGQRVYFHLWIEYANRNPIERWFCFERVDDAEFVTNPHALPLHPQSVEKACREAIHGRNHR